MKQTSIEWLIEQLMERGFQEKNYEILNQAKLLHKQEIIDAHNEGYMNISGQAEQYYQETFLSNGTSHRGNPRSDDHISDISKMVELPQQETLYTEEKVWEAMHKVRDSRYATISDDEIIQSLKQPKQ